MRSPGIYYGIAHDKIGKNLFLYRIPNRGAWLEYETDSNDVFYVRVDRTRKVPITVLIRALGIGTNAEIIDLFGEEPKILASFTKDTSENYQEGLLELYKKIRPGEPLAVESAESLITVCSSIQEDMILQKSDVINSIRNCIEEPYHRSGPGRRCCRSVTGEVLAEEGRKLTRELADTIQNSAVPYVWIRGERREIKVLSNLMVDLQSLLSMLIRKRLE